MAAAQGGKTEIVRLLPTRAQGRPPDGDEGWTALMLATSGGTSTRRAPSSSAAPTGRCATPTARPPSTGSTPQASGDEAARASWALLSLALGISASLIRPSILHPLPAHGMVATAEATPPPGAPSAHESAPSQAAHRSLGRRCLMLGAPPPLGETELLDARRRWRSRRPASSRRLAGQPLKAGRREHESCAMSKMSSSRARHRPWVANGGDTAPWSREAGQERAPCICRAGPEPCDMCCREARGRRSGRAIAMRGEGARAFSLSRTAPAKVPRNPTGA